MQIAWNIAPRSHDNLVTQILVNRGIPLAEQELFLSPDWEKGTHSPFAFTQMSSAVEAVFSALERKDSIVIHGDYDADGVSGSALLYSALHEIADTLHFDLHVEVFLPDREKDGYGVAMHTIERCVTEGKRMMITVDCGISNGLEFDRAHEAGMRVIVCDHHQLGTHFPSHAIVLHPLAPNETYPNKTLCGTGVAFKFASALIHEARKRGASFPDGHEKWFLDFVAIATVTDVMPLIGENRVLEYFGLKVLNKTRRPGLRAILASSGTELGDIDTQAIGFRIGPRLNAAGRLSSALIAFNAVVARTVPDAEAAAMALEGLNRDRQNIFKKAYEEAEKMAEEFQNHAVLVLVHDEWLPGIVGLIAGRLVNDFGKPAFVFAKTDGKYVGSGRSTGGLHLVQAMDSCGDMFLRKGGHPQACGLTLALREDVDRFRDGVNVFARSVFGESGPVGSFTIDAIVQPSTLSLELVDTLASCAPFGEGNRPPIFATLGATVMAAERMGSTGSHVRLTILEQGGGVSKCIGFGFAKKVADLPMGTKIDVAYEPGVNVWNGRRDVQCRMVDVKLTEPLRS